MIKTIPDTAIPGRPSLLDSPYELGLLFEKGGWLIPDRDAAALCYRRAARSGDDRAMYRLALLEMGQDRPSSISLMRKAARLGNADAAWWLARAFYYGVVLHRNYNGAVLWLNELYRREDTPPKAALLLGVCHYEGFGTETSFGQAVECLLRAFELSGRDRWGLSREGGGALSEGDIRTVQKILGECHYFGRGVAKDWCKALKYLKLSVMDGDHILADRDAEYLIGTCYYFHRGTRQDIPTALFWLRDAARQGSQEATLLLERRAARQARKKGRAARPQDLQTDFL